MEDLPVLLLAEIIKRIPSTSDLNSLALVSKRLYAVEAEHRDAIFISYGLSPPTSAMASLCSRFPNLSKVNISYYGWTLDHGAQLDNQGLQVLSSGCSLLTDLTLIHCSNIDDSGLAYIACCKKLNTLRLHTLSEISSSGLLSVAVGCKSLSTLYLNSCDNIGGTQRQMQWGPWAGSSTSYGQFFHLGEGQGDEVEAEEEEVDEPTVTGGMEWLEYLGRAGSLEELVLVFCKGISQYDLLKFGPGWMRLQRFEFEGKRSYNRIEPRDPAYVPHHQYKYGFSCESLKSLRLAHIVTEPEIGLRFLLGKCRGLERLCLHFVTGMNDRDMIMLSQNCRNLRSIKLVLMPLFCRSTFSTPLTDDSLKALALGCPQLEEVDLAFAGCDPCFPSEIGFKRKGLVNLIKSCPIRILILTSASFFDNKGMKVLASAEFLETLELMRCQAITDGGMHYIARAPRLVNLTLRELHNVTDGGVAKVAHAKKLESLTVEGCPRISAQTVEGAARLAHYSVDPPSLCDLQRY
ncbi:unnamed protein product [Urochloa humidicola]